MGHMEVNSTNLTTSCLRGVIDHIEGRRNHHQNQSIFEDDDSFVARPRPGLVGWSFKGHWCTCRRHRHDSTTWRYTRDIRIWKSVVFNPPPKLPRRKQEVVHRIQIDESLWAFRYWHTQKEELRNQLRTCWLELFKLVWAPSLAWYCRWKRNAAIGSSALFALNKATIPNKFLILMIEEPLDELYGPCVYLKLDLKSTSSNMHAQTEEFFLMLFN